MNDLLNFGLDSRRRYMLIANHMPTTIDYTYGKKLMVYVVSFYDKKLDKFFGDINIPVEDLVNKSAVEKTVEVFKLSKKEYLKKLKGKK